MAKSNIWDVITGGETSTTQTKVSEPSKSSTNWGLVIGGIALAVAAALGIAWVFGAFKKKPA